MRSIKFRGKSTDSYHMWCYGSLVIYDNKIYSIQGWDINHLGIPKSKDYWTEKLVHPETVGQYIGLNDVNGEEIYEGDILKSTYAVFLVTPDEDFTGFDMAEFTNKGAVAATISKNLLENYNFRVIGNKYDNKELLEKYGLQRI